MARVRVAGHRREQTGSPSAARHRGSPSTPPLLLTLPSPLRLDRLRCGSQRERHTWKRRSWVGLGLGLGLGLVLGLGARVRVRGQG